MRKRRPLYCERLEQRELLANSFAALLPPDLACLASLEAPAAPIAALSMTNGPAVLAHGQPQVESRPSSDAVGAFFADHATLDGWLHASAPLASGETDLGFGSLPESGWNAD